MKNLNILVISYHYPPDRAVGGQRARKLVEALRAAGHDVVVIAAGDPTADPTVLRVPPLPSVREIYASVRDRYAARNRKYVPEGLHPPSPEPGAAAHPSRIPVWKRWIYSLIWLPDDKQGFAVPAIRQARRLPTGRPDLIYTTAPPFSTHLAGLLLKALTGTRWVAEFRDPWTANPWKPAEMRSSFSDWLERRLERLCLESADLLVAVSEGIAARLVETGATTPITVVRNGIERLRTDEAAQASSHSGEPFEFVYAGSFYYTRDPFPFLKALSQIIKAKSFTKNNIHVRFIGATEDFEGHSISDYVRDEGLADFVDVEGWIEPAESLKYIMAADALLLLALDQPDQVPNKVYEYLGARRPILAVADEDGETARLLNRAGGHVVVPVNSAERIRPALEEMLNAGRRGPVGDSRLLATWTTAAQMAGLITSLSETA